MTDVRYREVSSTVLQDAVGAQFVNRNVSLSTVTNGENDISYDLLVFICD